MKHPNLQFVILISFNLILNVYSNTSTDLHSFNNLSIGNESFIGAVIEYGGIYNGTGEEQVMFNLEQYEHIIQTVSSKVANISIVVFPEVGLQRTRHGPDKTFIYGEPIPEGYHDITPCTDNKTKVLKRLSCLAKKYKIYLVVNVIERYTNTTGEEDYFSTNVVFNRNGTIIARYRKFNVYGIDGKPLKKPSTADLSYFDTDFGVRFGTFISFDIVFKTPAMDLIQKHNITHFVFPVAWSSALPFLTALQIQAGWAHGNNVVLMAAGLNDPTTGSTGTGVYAGSFVVGANQTASNKNFAVIAVIPKNLTDFKGENLKSVKLALNSTKENVNKLKLLKDKIGVYSSELVVENKTYSMEAGDIWGSSRTEVQNRKVCFRNFCCTFTLNFTVQYRDFSIPHNQNNSGDAFGANEYQLLAFDGVRSYGEGIATGGIKVCAIVSCIDNEVNSCNLPTYNSSQKVIVFSSQKKLIKTGTIFHNITVKAEVGNTNDVFIMPDTLSRSPYLFNPITGTQFGKLENDYVFEKDSVLERNTTIVLMSTTSELRNIGTFGIYARVFSRDGLNATVVGKNKGSRMTLHIIFVFINILYFLLQF